MTDIIPAVYAESRCVLKPMTEKTMSLSRVLESEERLRQFTTAATTAAGKMKNKIMKKGAEPPAGVTIYRVPYRNDI